MSSEPLLERLRAANPLMTQARTDEQLWASVVARAGDPRLATGARALDSRSRRRPMLRSGGIFTTLLAVAGLVAALVFAFGPATSAPPAFAVTRSQPGEVTITLRQITGITGLNAKLAAMGTRIKVVPVVPGCVAPVHTVSNGNVVPGPARTLAALPSGGALESMTISVDTIPGRTFVVAVSKSGLAEVDVVVVGPAPPCVGTAARRAGDPFLLFPGR